MYCPQCGQQQVAETVRFCPRCGFLLEGVSVVMASGGQVPTRYIQPGKQALSARSKGVRQGAMVMLSTLLVVPITAILGVHFLRNPQVVVPLAAILCFVGGLLRILYALIMEDANPSVDPNQIPTYPAIPALDRSAHQAALPPVAHGATGWRQRPNTAEIYQPPSITENTTRLLDKDDPKVR